MSWVKLDDQILGNRKIRQAGAVGFALHVAGIIYCARHLTNGFIPEASVATLLDWPGSWPPVPQIVDTLVTLALWHRRPTGYQIHDYLHYNPAKDVVLAKRRGTPVAPVLFGSSSGEDRKKTRVFKSSQEAEKNKDPTDPVRLSALLPTGRLAALLRREKADGEVQREASGSTVAEAPPPDHGAR